MQAYFKLINGVVNTTVGYANGNIEHPKYEDLKNGRATHAETLKIEYDEKVISLKTILVYYFKVIDPYSVNKQGEDEGIQYRTGIFYLNDLQKDEINKYLSEIPDSKNFKVLIEPLEMFSFSIVSSPRLFR